MSAFDPVRVSRSLYLENRITAASRAAIFMLRGGWFAKETIHDGLPYKGFFVLL